MESPFQGFRMQLERTLNRRTYSEVRPEQTIRLDDPQRSLSTGVMLLLHDSLGQVSPPLILAIPQHSAGSFSLDERCISGLCSAFDHAGGRA